MDVDLPAFVRAQSAKRNASVSIDALSIGMAYDPAAIEATLAAAVGDDPALIAELRYAFLESAGAAVLSLEQATAADAWVAAAWRLKGLAASFGAVRLAALAGEAIAAGAPDPGLTVKLKRMVARL